MTSDSVSVHLSRPVDEASDHALGSPSASISLVEYGSYDCPYCSAANERIEEARAKLGDRLYYVFRHRPIPGNTLAQRAAVFAEVAAEAGLFWQAHVALMKRSNALTESDIAEIAAELGLEWPPAEGGELQSRAIALVDDDIETAADSGVRVTPSFFINGRRYEGVWDDSAFASALLGSLGHRVRTAALDFARWAPSSGLLLLLASIVAVAFTNSPWAGAFLRFWEISFGFTLGDTAFRLSLLHWVNDGLLTLFFLVVGLEIKREFTVGHLTDPRAAALPIAAAIGGMVVPVLLYRLVLPAGDLAHGWGVPMSTDTAFAVALIVMLGRRVPVELRIFLTAAAIVDDIGAIIVVAVFYSGELQWNALALAGAALAGLVLLNRLAVYRVAPYLLLGVVLWGSVYAGGLHATLAGVLLALFIPTREPPNLRALRAQADSILIAEARQSGDALRQGPSAAAMRALDAIHDRLESPADRMLRVVSVRSNYFVLPLFALANAGVALSPSVIHGNGPLVAAIGLGLVVGKPLGMAAFSFIAVKSGWAMKPGAYSWTQLTGAGILAGIGFTMSLFIAGEAFDEAPFAAAKIAIFVSSILAALLGVAVLWCAPTSSEDEASTGSERAD